MLKILVLCTGNSCRSQMAEGFLKYYGRDMVDVKSAGLSPSRVNRHAISVMKEAGIDISKQTSDHVNDYLDGSWDYVITVCDNANEQCPYFPGDVERLHWPFEDPATATGSKEEVTEIFRRTRDQIGTRVKFWLTNLGVPAV